jgi:hypothetical protein
MGLFGKRVVDLSAEYKPGKRVARSSSSSSNDSSDLGFLGNLADSNSDSSNSTSSDISWDNEPATATVGEYQNKKQKLAKRFLDMTNKIEDLSNQLYHMKQRMEVIERKLKISFD